MEKTVKFIIDNDAKIIKATYTGVHIAFCDGNKDHSVSTYNYIVENNITEADLDTLYKITEATNTSFYEDKGGFLDSVRGSNMFLSYCRQYIDPNYTVSNPRLEEKKENSSGKRNSNIRSTFT